MSVDAGGSVELLPTVQTGKEGSEVVDELHLDGVARREVVASASDGLVDDVILRAGHAEREGVRVAVHGQERVARAVARRVDVRLSRERGEETHSGREVRRRSRYDGVNGNGEE